LLVRHVGCMSLSWNDRSPHIGQVVRAIDFTILVIRTIPPLEII
jgi:hypothetical protein